MNKYVKGDRIINATEKAYELLYKEQGFKPYKESKAKKATDDNKIKDNDNENNQNNNDNTNNGAK